MNRVFFQGKQLCQFNGNYTGYLVNVGDLPFDS